MAELLVAEEYKVSLADLKANSKPLINMLTMLAEENQKYAQQIVDVIEAHILKVQCFNSNVLKLCQVVWWL